MNTSLPSFFTTPGGEKLVILPLDEYESLIDLVDAAQHDATMAAIAAGEVELLTSEEVRDFLAAATPLAFWRRKRGMTQKALAAAVGATQSYIASLEAGKRKGDPVLFLRLSKALAVRMEDLIAE